MGAHAGLPAGGSAGGDPDTTTSLLARAREGDGSARDRLLTRCLPILRRWAHGRLPGNARDLFDTDDLVQITLIRALDHLKSFEPRREGAFMAYLRRILVNQIKDRVRMAATRPAAESVPAELAGEGPSPLERAISREELEAYEAALQTLPGNQHEAVLLRLEMGYTHAEVAQALGLSSSDAARMLVARALDRLAEVMDGQV